MKSTISAQTTARAGPPRVERERMGRIAVALEDERILGYVLLVPALLL